MAAISENFDAPIDKQKAVLFLQKIASKLPSQSVSESTIIGLFENVVESLSKGSIRSTILADLDNYYGVFDAALKKKQEDSQTASSTVAASEIDRTELKRIAGENFPVTKARMLLGTVDINFLSSGILRSSDTDTADNSELHILIAVQCAQLNAPQISLMLLNSIQAVKPSLSSENLSRALLTRLAMRSYWCVEETESSGCLWGYSMLNSSESLGIIAMSTLSVITAIKTEVWVFSFGFLGYWGLKCSAFENEERLGVFSNFLDICTVDNIDDCDHSDVILCLTLFFIWVNKLPKTKNSERLTARVLSLLGIISGTAKENVQLFWLDSLYPLLENKKISDLASKSKKVKSFSNNGKEPMRSLLNWVCGEHSLVEALERSMCDLIGDSENKTPESEEISEKPEIGEMKAEVNTDSAVIIASAEKNSDKKRKLSISKNEIEANLTAKDIRTEKNKKIQGDTIPERSMKVDDDQTEQDDTDEGDIDVDVDVASFEMDYTGDSSGVLAFMSEVTETKKSKKQETATPRKSARNINKLAAEVELKTDMEIELENLEKTSRSSKIPKKSVSKKLIDSDVEVAVTEEVVQEEIKEIKIKKSTPKKAAKKAVEVADERIIEISENKDENENEIAEVMKKTSTVKKTKGANKSEWVEGATETVNLVAVEVVEISKSKLSTPKKSRGKKEIVTDNVEVKASGKIEEEEDTVDVVVDKPKTRALKTPTKKQPEKAKLLSSDLEVEANEEVTEIKNIKSSRKKSKKLSTSVEDVLEVENEIIQDESTEAVESKVEKSARKTRERKTDQISEIKSAKKVKK